jgi:uncharacterized membrane protein
MITEPIALLFVIVAVVLGAILLQKRFAVFKSVGAALIGTITGIVLSNSGILPGQSPVYDFVNGTGVNIGLLLILLGVDLRSMRQMGPRMLAAFLLGTFATAVGTMGAAVLFYPQVGPETWKVTGQFAGAYTGGTINFVAVGRAFGTSSDLFTAALASDVLVTSAWLAICLMVPILEGRKKQAVTAEGGGMTAGVALTDAAAQQHPAEVTVHAPTVDMVTIEQTFYDSRRSVALVDVAALTAYVAGALWLSSVLGSLFPGIPGVLWPSTLGLIAAQVRPLRALPGSAMLGNYLLLLFVTCNGARSLVAAIMQTGPGVFYLASVAVIIHGIVIFGLGRLLKFDLPTLAVASQANIGASATALAVATAGGYVNLVLPGIAAGLLGYGIGTYVGYAIGLLTRSVLGG